ncbi:MAG TPA: hypothetical protein DCZ40_08625 [Lachnospiraceae bacterium]|nr:hypothetical protein [Lachnospiraceae bacterium]
MILSPLRRTWGIKMEITDFCKSLDFMKLGQAINRQNWQIALNTVQRMQRQSAETGDPIFDKNFTNLRHCLLHKDQLAAKNVLAVVIAKRAQILNHQEREEK